MKLQPGQGQHWLSVQLRIIESVKKMDPSRSRCRQTHAQFSGELSISASHEGRRFFVSALHKADLVLAGPQGLHDAVDAVSRQAENDLYIPVNQRFDENIGRGCSHSITNFRVCTNRK